MKKIRYTEEQIAFALKPAPARGSLQKNGDFRDNILHPWTTSVLQVLNLVLGCYLHLSGIRKICAQMGNPYAIASTTGRPQRPV